MTTKLGQKLKLFQLPNGLFLIFFVACLTHLQTLCLMRNYRIQNLGQRVRTPGVFMQISAEVQFSDYAVFVVLGAKLLYIPFAILCFSLPVLFS